MSQKKTKLNKEKLWKANSFVTLKHLAWFPSKRAVLCSKQHSGILPILLLKFINLAVSGFSSGICDILLQCPGFFLTVAFWLHSAWA